MKLPLLILLIVFISFFTLFVYRSANVMRNTALYDFDEGHRAETARQMKRYKSFFIPLTGSPWDRVIRLSIPATRDNPLKRLYYHLERPPLVYLMMIGSISIFGENQWAFRLPSFILGFLVIPIFFYFARSLNKINWSAFSIGILALFTSSDLWLSSQYAQLDTGLTAFLYLSLIFLLIYVQERKALLIYASGASFALGVLSKGQPAIIFILPLAFLFLTKKLSLKDVFKFFLGSGVLLAPWSIYISLKFSLPTFIQVFSEFAFSSAGVEVIHHKAPFFWYLRWWWESFRPGWTLFLALLIFDILKHNLNWQKGALLSYILGGLLLFSIQANKIWWYILPFVPAIATYIYLSLSDYLKKYGITSILLVIFFASVPIMLNTTNKLAVFYGVAIVLLSLFIIMLRLNLDKFKSPLLLTVMIFSLYIFYQRFPVIVPYHLGLKPVATFFSTLPEPKCLWVKDLPVESALFYGKSIEVDTFSPLNKPKEYCRTYIIVKEEDVKSPTFKDKKIFYRSNGLALLLFKEFNY